MGTRADVNRLEAIRSRLAAVDVRYVTRRFWQIVRTVARNTVAPSQQRTGVVEDAEGAQLDRIATRQPQS